MSAISQKFITSKDGTKIYYETADGTSQQPPLFFVHGVGGDLDAWQFIQSAMFEKGFSTLALDLRGHGYSEHPRNFKGYAVDKFIEDILTVLDIENIQKVVLIGHSLGAVLVTQVALKHPERIDRLVLISSSYIPPPYFKIPGIFFLMNALAFMSLPPIKPDHSLYPAGKHHEDLEYFGLFRTILRNSLRSYILSSKEILKTNLLPQLKELSMPTLIISGTKDSIFPPHISDKIHLQIQNSILKKIDGGNHVVVLNNIPEVVEAISTFIGK